MGMGMHSFFQLGMKNGNASNAFLFSSRNGNGNAFLKLRNGPMSGREVSQPKEKVEVVKTNLIRRSH